MPPRMPIPPAHRAPVPRRSTRGFPGLPTSLAALALALALWLAGPAMTFGQSQWTPGARPRLQHEVPQGFGVLSIIRHLQSDQYPLGDPRTDGRFPGGLTFSLTAPTGWQFSNTVLANPADITFRLVGGGTGTPLGLTNTVFTVEELDRQAPQGPWLARFLARQENGDPFAGFIPFFTTDRRPPVPRLLGLASLQGVDPDRPTTIHWEPWTLADSGDQVTLALVDALGREVFSTSTVDAAPGIAGTGVGQAPIPAGLLERGRLYHGYVGFHARILGGVDAPSQVALRGFDSRVTRFTLVTSPPDAPELAVLAGAGFQGTRFAFQVRGEPGASFRIESSTDLRSWVLERTITLGGNSNQFVFLPQSDITKPRFHRALRTITPEAGEPARLTLTRLRSDRLELGITGTPGGHYFVERSTNGRDWELVIPEGVFLPNITPGTPLPPGTAVLNGTLRLGIPLTPAAPASAVYRLTSFTGI